MKPFILLLLALSLASHAKEVKLEHEGLTLNADLEGAEENRLPQRMFLILHGTLGHKNMEIIQGLQQQLADNGKASLAPNLSLTQDDRHGFYDCATPHFHRHDDAVAELQVWADWLKDRGVQKLDLIGHSRGGNQVLLFALRQQGLQIASVTSVAPMVFQVRHSRQELEGLEKPTSLKAVRRFLHCNDTRVSRRSLESYWFDENQHTPALWQQYPGRYLLITGSEDRLTQALAPFMHTLPAGAVHLDVDGADHFFRDLYLDEVVEFILEHHE